MKSYLNVLAVILPGGCATSICQLSTSRTERLPVAANMALAGLQTLRESRK